MHLATSPKPLSIKISITLVRIIVKILFCLVAENVYGTDWEPVEYGVSMPSFQLTQEVAPLLTITIAFNIPGKNELL